MEIMKAATSSVQSSSPKKLKYLEGQVKPHKRVAKDGKQPTLTENNDS